MRFADNANGNANANGNTQRQRLSAARGKARATAHPRPFSTWLCRLTTARAAASPWPARAKIVPRAICRQCQRQWQQPNGNGYRQARSKQPAHPRPGPPSTPRGQLYAANYAATTWATARQRTGRQSTKWVCPAMPMAHTHSLAHVRAWA